MLRPKIPLAFLVASLFSVCLSAQTNTEVNASLQLNLSQPGARSLAMGGAFIGLADDATAAFTNPAGLANLSTMEVALEGRAWEFTTTFTDDGDAFFNGDELDDSGLVEGTAESSTEGYSFGSFVFPKGKWVWAIYRHQLADFETSFQTRGARGFGNGFDFFLLPVVASTNLEITGTGVAAGVKLSDDVSLGFGIINYEMMWESSTRRFLSVGARDVDFWANQQDIEAEDDAVSASVGVEWKISERWRFGAVYRRGAEFDFQTTNLRGPANTDSGSVVGTASGSFRVPDVIGAGIAYKTSSFRILLDWVRVEYSALTESTVDAFSVGGDTAAAASGLTVDDVDEIHLGFEYVFTQLASPVAFRVGGWFDPDHEIRYEGPFVTSSGRAEALLFRAGDDEIHYTGGFGVSFLDGKLELNAGVDLSEKIDTGSLSLVWRFL